MLRRQKLRPFGEYDPLRVHPTLDERNDKRSAHRVHVTQAIPDKATLPEFFGFSRADRPRILYFPGLLRFGSVRLRFGGGTV